MIDPIQFEVMRSVFDAAADEMAAAFAEGGLLDKHQDARRFFLCPV